MTKFLIDFFLTALILILFLFITINILSYFRGKKVAFRQMQKNQTSIDQDYHWNKFKTDREREIKIRDEKIEDIKKRYNINEEF